jgi:hypothetical protein
MVTVECPLMQVRHSALKSPASRIIRSVVYLIEDEETETPQYTIGIGPQQKGEPLGSHHEHLRIRATLSHSFNAVRQFAKAHRSAHIAKTPIERGADLMA